MESILSRLQRLEARLDASAAMVPSPLLPIQSAAEDQQHGVFNQRMHGLNLVGSTPKHATFTSPSPWEPQVTRRGAYHNGQPSTWDPGRHSASASVATAFTSPPPTVQHPPLPAQADTMQLPLGFRHPSQHSWRPPLPQQAPWPSNQQKLLVNPSLDAQCKLSKLSQVGSVLDYQIQFEKLSSRATETHERILVSLFISGLKPDIRWDLERNRPTALKEAFASARYQESRLEDIRLARNKVVEELAEYDVMGEIEENVDMLLDYEEAKANERVETNQIPEIKEEEESREFQSETDARILDVDHPWWKMMVVSLYSQAKEVDPFWGVLIPTATVMGGIIIGHHGLKKRKRYALREMAREDVFLKVWRRVVVFGIYALEEVYKDLLYLHLEDKVVFKGGGVDTSLGRYLIICWA